MQTTKIDLYQQVTIADYNHYLDDLHYDGYAQQLAANHPKFYEEGWRRFLEEYS